MTVGFLSLPTELICRILLLLTPGDLSRCAITCRTVCDAARNSVHIQYKLELYAQGITETATLDSITFSRKTYLLKKLASLWRSDFHAKIIFLGAVGHFMERVPRPQSVKCGLWWMLGDDNLFIRSCDGNVELSWTVLPSQGRFVRSVIVDPLQDLVVTVLLSFPVSLHVPHPGQDHRIFQVEFRLASSKLPYVDSAFTSLECTHTFDEPDRIVVLYYLNLHRTGDLFIRIIDWRTGHAKSYPLRDPVGSKSNFHLVDEQKIVLIGEQGHLALYTLHELDGSPQHRATYLLADLQRSFRLKFVVYATPLFHGTAARPDLMPAYVPSLESQIMVLQVLCHPWSIILVIDMVIFSRQAVHSETPVEIPWSDWGPQYTWCFPSHWSHQISVFGSKMAHTLPWNCIPESGATLEGFSDDQGHFYVHIWNFNKRLIARAENTYDRSSPDPHIRKLGQLTQSCFGDMILTHHYTATVCRTPFMANRFERLLLEQDRLILSWLPTSSLDIQMVYPVIDMDLAE
ncbi:hypothetical protein K503DRAFT_132490 [Rhizopogon vinicolor AM-OR11-026]|uniref:F-box domain-containing protein n=1 Tax=Rhizopogon vinicolor AM-OR11-026 TaxID=1314800 RepID=A0A1B7N1W5_9AGAM|nr:hypothetical protein K503DRAFT_132490 [Rhizopogon vinicolor AM-OR11-026]